jgi:hypothetical protein
MLLSSSSTLRGRPCVSSQIGTAMTFNKRNIVANDIDYTDTKGRTWKPSSNAASPLSATATSQSTVIAVAAK